MLGITEMDLEILYNSDLQTLLTLCQLNRYYQTLCSNPHFWGEKIRRDFQIEPTVKSRENYILLNTFQQIVQNLEPEASVPKRWKELIRNLYQMRYMAHTIVIDYAIDAKNQAEMMKWLLMALAESNQVDTLKLAVNHNLQMDSEIADIASAGGALQTLEWLATYDIYPLESGAIDAARYGHVHVLDWLETKGIHATDDAFYWASYNGQVEVLKWLSKRGYPKSKQIQETSVQEAADENRLETIMWFAEKGVYPKSYYWPVVRNHSEVVLWMLENGIPPNDEEDIKMLEYKGYLPPGSYQQALRDATLRIWEEPENSE